jgi:hypothetical protein
MDKTVQREGDYDDKMLEEKMIQTDNAVRKWERGIKINSPENELAVRNISVFEVFHIKLMEISTSELL